MQQFLCGVWAVFFVGLSLAAFAQGTEEQVISGAVADSSGAVIPGAKVVIANVATGIRTELITNPEGFYRSPSLRPGDYHVEVSKPGFQNLVRSGLTLHLAESLRLDLTLQLGTASQTIEVTGAAPDREVLRLSDAARWDFLVERFRICRRP